MLASWPSWRYSKGSSAEFEIVGARPPHVKDMVHKVGRTTGWTSGKINKVKDDKRDSTCPGNALGLDDNANGKEDDELYHFECLVRASYQSSGEDSGSPVFVKTSTDEAVLVGVHWGGIGDDGLFIPIERIYAESLLRDYDWFPVRLRPLPALDDSRDDIESLRLTDGGWTIRAEFAAREFSQSNEGMVYEAVLHRNGVEVTDTSGAVYKKRVSRDTEGDAPGSVARFDVSRIPSAQRSGELTVKVRLCPHAVGSAASTSHCSGYGSSGTRTLEPAPAPQNFTRTGASANSVRLD